MSDLVGDILNGSELAYWVAGSLSLILALLIWGMTAKIWMACLFAPSTFFGALSGVYAGRELGIRLHDVQEADVVLWSCAGIIVAIALLLVVMRLLYMLGEPRKGIIAPGPVTR